MTVRRLQVAQVTFEYIVRAVSAAPHHGHRHFAVGDPRKTNNPDPMPMRIPGISPTTVNAKSPEIRSPTRPTHRLNPRKSPSFGFAIDRRLISSMSASLRQEAASHNP